MGRPRILSPEEAKRRERKQKAAWKDAHPDKVLQQAKSRYWRNRDEIRRRARIVESSPEHRAAQHARRIKREFGLSADEYEKKLAEQHGVCAICKNTCKTHRRLSVDHNHTTKQIRSLLCARCNVTLGWVEEQPSLLLAMVEYLEFWSKK